MKESFEKSHQTFIRLIYDKYKYYDENDFKLSEDDLKVVNMKKTIKKLLLIYHPDKISNKIDKIFARKIACYLNDIFVCFKS